MEENWKVYIHVVHTSHGDMRYVGITSKQYANHRWANGKGYNYNDYFCKAIQKYGWDNIEHIIIAENLSKEDACNMEINLIEYFKTTDRNYGYNHSTGGEYGSSGIKCSDGVKKILRERWLGKNNPNYGKHISKEAIEKANKNKIEYYKTHNYPMCGKHHKEETKEKLRECNLGKKLSPETVQKMIDYRTGRKQNPITIAKRAESLKKPIYQIDKNTLKIIKEWDSQTTASKELNFERSGIRQCCKKQLKTYKGFIWIYKQDYNNFIKENNK